MSHHSELRRTLYEKISVILLRASCVQSHPPGCWCLCEEQITRLVWQTKDGNTDSDTYLPGRFCSIVRAAVQGDHSLAWGSRFGNFYSELWPKLGSFCEPNQLGGEREAKS